MCLSRLRFIARRRRTEEEEEEKRVAGNPEDPPSVVSEGVSDRVFRTVFLSDQIAVDAVSDMTRVLNYYAGLHRWFSRAPVLRIGVIRLCVASPVLYYAVANSGLFLF